MKREIKFRAWDKKNNLMRPQYGVLAKIEWSQEHKPVRIGIYEYVQINENGDGDWDGFELQENEFELMQFTGLKPNGVEMYEGDIVKGCCFNGSYAYGKVIQSHFGWIITPIGKFLEGYDNIDRLGIEIIGNIYEHPELLA